ncbi:MAG: low molecular weight protein-tyrosine-phosphatase [Rikenellaceae bacterium]
MKVLFVCLGNICRSPAAEGVFKALVATQGLEDKITVDSAGTYGGHAGDLPDSRMRAAALRRGLILDSRSRQIKSDDFYDSDMVIVMDDSNYERVSRLAPDRESLQKLYRMREFLTRYTIDHIPDPYYEGADGFEYVLDLLEDACENLLLKVK